MQHIATYELHGICVFFPSEYSLILYEYISPTYSYLSYISVSYHFYIID